MSLFVGEQVCFAQHPRFRFRKKAPQPERGLPKYKKQQPPLPSMQQIMQRFYQTDWKVVMEQDRLPNPAKGKEKTQMVFNEEMLAPIYLLRRTLAQQAALEARAHRQNPGNALERIAAGENDRSALPPEEQAAQISQFSAAEKQFLSNGKLPWQATHSYVNSSADAWDLITYFPDWVQRNQSYIVSVFATNRALESVQAAMQGGTPDDNVYKVVERLFEMDLGRQPDGSWAYVIYRGDNPSFPKALDFHRIVKIEGFPAAQAAAALALPQRHILFKQQEDKLIEMKFVEGITAQEFDAVIRAMVPEGFEVRMGAHEFEIRNERITPDFELGQLHLHIEKIQPAGAEDPDISYVIELKLRKLVQGKKPHQILKLYRQLFLQYMDDYMATYTLTQPVQH